MGSVIRFILILGIVFLIVLFAMRPELLDQVWLWITGLIGLIIKLFQRFWSFIEGQFDNAQTKVQPVMASGKDEGEQTIDSYARTSTISGPAHKRTELIDERTQEDFEKPEFIGITLNLQRLKDDGVSTLGSLSIKDDFFCYTLEDTHRDPGEKIWGQTRIPAGEYRIDFKKVVTPKTEQYQASSYSGEWFTYHLELKNVPGFDAIYIHNGGSHQDTQGCILVSDQYVHGPPITFTNSKNTFKKLYLYLSQELEKGIEIRIIIKDEYEQ